MANLSIDLNKQNDLYNPEIVRKIMALPFRMRLKLLSTDFSQKIQAIGQKYQFELLRLENITRLIREYYFGEVRLEDFPKEIEKRMGVSLLTAQEIARYIKSEIIDWDPWGEYIAGLPKLTVREIVEKYPKIADTEITAGYIELKKSEDFSDPTIKNWIRDYVSYFGYESHSQMVRTQYLFRGENAKSLNSQDREKLAVVLKSFDENIPLPVDEEKNEIVFDSATSDRDEINQRKNGIRPESEIKIPEIIKKTQWEPKEKKTFMKPPFARDVPRAEYPAQSETEKSAFPQAQTRVHPVSKIAYKVTSSIPGEQPGKPAGSDFQPNLPAKTASRPAPVQPDAMKDKKAVFSYQEKSPERKQEIDNYFSAPEASGMPPIKVHKITERATAKVSPQQKSGRPMHKIIDPFSQLLNEPKLNGNIVDLSAKNSR